MAERARQVNNVLRSAGGTAASATRYGAVGCRSGRRGRRGGGKSGRGGAVGGGEVGGGQGAGEEMVVCTRCEGEEEAIV